MDAKRFKIEKEALEYGFKNRYVFHNIGTDNEWLEIGLKTNIGNTYRLKITLGDFPYRCPSVYVLYPEPEKLKDYRGRRLYKRDVSASMHLLPPDDDGHIHLCHYGANWHNNVTLYRVALKCLLWLNCYDGGHLKSGHPIDHYLRHDLEPYY